MSCLITFKKLYQYCLFYFCEDAIEIKYTTDLQACPIPSPNLSFQNKPNNIEFKLKIILK